MRTILVALLSILFVSNAMAEIKTRKVQYKAGDKTMIGFLAWDDSTNAKRPGVIVFPEWWGTGDYTHQRAQQLAQLGYVGFAADMYGDGKTTDDPTQAGKLAGEVKGNPQLAAERVQAALEALKSQPMVDPEKVAAIGYCFGGSMALLMARQNMPIEGVVSFHGDLSTQSPAHKVTPRVLILTGKDDAFVPPEQVQKFENEMKSAGANYKVVSYEGAHHSFTNPDADRHKIPNIKYNAKADKESWEEMKNFLADLFK